MNEKLHNKLLSEVGKLKRITSDLKIEDVVNLVAWEQRNFIDKKIKGLHLSSPLRQGMYLLAIASAQPEPEEGKIIDNGKHDQIVKTLNSIFNQYALAYFPSESDQLEEISEKWRNDRRVAMPAFLHYFATGFKASTTQVKSWIKYYYDGFEKEIIGKYGISHNEMLDVAEYFESKILDSFEGLKNNFIQLKEYHQNFNSVNEEGKVQAIEDLKNNAEFQSLIKDLHQGMNEPYLIDVSDIESKFGEKVKASILTNFTTIRGSSSEIKYITDDNPVVLKPIISPDGKKLYFVVNNSFYQSIIYNLEGFLSDENVSKSFLKTRDKRLEEKSFEQFKKIFPDSAEFYDSAFETNTGHYEHDLVIVHNDNLLVVESKASPPKLPMRDPAKAFVRISRHFKSDSGIQKAYDQAHSLESNLIKNGVVNLYTQKGDHLRELKLDDFKKVYCICITRDDFGALATDFTLLLEKEIDSKYPWSISVTDLETMIDGFIHLDKGIDELYRYLDQRLELHGKVFGIDELEYAGAFLNYGGLEKFIEEKADFIPLDISESNIFDKIFMAEISGEKFILNPSEAIFDPIDRRKLFVARPSDGAGSSLKEVKKSKRKMAKASRRKNRKK